MEVREPVAKYLAKPAFKQTEVGVIPADWEVTSLAQLCSMKSGSGITSAAIDQIANYPCYGGNGLRGYSSKFTHEGRYALVGRQGALCGNVFGVSGKFYASEHAIVVTPRTEIDIDWLIFVLRDMNLNQYSESSAQPGLSVSKLLCLPVATPAKRLEQQAIAEALSDADALIETLEQLLAKKRQIKQGAMQELLTGKKRLPGFAEKWEVKRLGEIAQLRGERIDPRLGSTQEFCVELEHIGQGSGTLVGHTRASDQSSLKSVFRKDDVLFGKLRAYLRKYWLAPRDGVCSTEIWVLVAKSSLLTPQFLFQLVMVDRFIEAASSAHGTHMPRSDWNIVRNYEVALPPIAEQTAIAIVLSDMDAEIAVLEARLAKARSLKQGMMQELLTGRIRLLPPKAEVIPLPVQGENSKPAKAKSHNWQINEAVVIAVLAKHFGSEQWPLGRKRYTKLSYLLHRHVEHQAEGYLKKAAGPYNPATKYKGPEGIALKNGYIRQHARDQFSGFVAAEKIGEAEDYFLKWYGADALTWLKQFRIEKNDELELLATVDMAMEDLRRAGDPMMLETVKQIIKSHPEWQAKLDRPIFSDANIERVIVKCHNLFGD